MTATSNTQFGIPRMERVAETIKALRSIPQPVICVIQGLFFRGFIWANFFLLSKKGAAAGAGFSLAMACDIRIATKNAFFVASFSGLGISGSELGLSYFLPKSIGLSNASYYTMTRERITADDAYR